ncbi:MAG: hypothetical protein K2K42_06100, partial [Eubacterium sp.]|nr:hypothetical protein [Eubacterium sp.]
IAPFSDLINTLFNAGTSEWFADVDEHDNIIPGTGFKVTGAHGYTNAVKPLMQALGLTSENGLMSTADFRQSVADNGNDYVFFNVVNPLLSRINNIIKSPGTELFGTIASLGAFIGDKEGAFTNKGNLQFAIEALLSPILSILDPIVDLADDEKQLTVFSLVFEILGIKHKGETKDKDIAVTWDNFHEHLFDVVAFFLKPNKEKPDNLYAETLESVMFIKNITINGVKYTLELPEYDLSKLKDCTVSDDIEKRSADAFVTIFRYIERILKENSVEKNKDGEFTSNLDETAFITKLIYNLVDGDNKDTYSVMKPYLQNVFGAKTDTLLITVIRVFANLSESVLDQLYPEIADVTEHWNEMLKLRDDLPNVNYADLALEEVTNAVGTVKESVQNALDAYAKDFDLENLTTTYIYKNSIPNLLANVIFPLSDNNLIESVLRIVGIDLSRDFIIKELQKSGYEELAALMIDADKRIEASDTDLKLADAMKLKIQAKDEDGNLLWNDAEKKDPKMIVNPDIEKLWYVEDADGFMENVWATGGNSSRDPETIDASYRFKRALITVLAPFREFLGVFFAYNTITIFNDPNEGHPDSHNVRLLGDRGYGNAIKPLLEALGFDAVPAETYLKNVAYDSDYILYGIIDPILARIDDILADPVGELLDTLNSLALYIGNGGLQESIKNLLNPLTKLLSPIVRLVLGEVVDDNQIDMRTMSGLYDLIIGFVAEFFDIEVLQLTDEQREEGFSIWENIHKWSYLREVIQRVLKLAKIEKITINGVDYPI